jgi:membrane protein implicated in regulation of membrane protease activity
MTRVRAFLAAVWEFVVGDDWRTAIGVALAIALTALIASAGISAWWVMPLAVLGLLALSIRRAARRRLQDEPVP